MIMKQNNRKKNTLRIFLYGILFILIISISTLLLTMRFQNNKIEEVDAANVVIKVSPTGNDQNDGVINPLKTINAAVSKANPGTTINIAPGTYNEQVVVNKSGTSSARITIEGSGDNTIIDSGELLKSWTRATEVGIGVYKTAWIKSSMVNPVTWNDTYLIGLNNSRATASNWKDYFNNAEWTAYRGIYALRDKTIYLRLEGNVNPNTQRITGAQHLSSGILLDNADYVTVRNLQIKNAYAGVQLTNGSGFNIVENTFIPLANDSILIYQNAHDNKIRNNRLTLSYGKPLHYEYAHAQDVWDAFRVLSTGTRQAVSIYFAGNNNEIYENNIYDHFQGIIDRGIGGNHPKNAQDRELAVKHNGNLKVYKNKIQRCSNSGLSIGGGAINNQWYENEVDKCLISLRFHDHVSGPVYVYKNILKNPSDVQIYYDTASIAPTFIYHNTLEGGARALNFGYGKTDFANNAPNTWYINNVFNTKKIGAMGGSGGAFSNRPIFAYNFVPSDSTDSSWLQDGNNIVSSNPATWENSQFRPSSNSQILGKAFDLRNTLTIRSKRIPAPLPGLDNYYSNSKDMGAIQRSQTSLPNPTITQMPTPLRTQPPLPSPSTQSSISPTPVITPNDQFIGSLWSNLTTSIPATNANLVDDIRYPNSPSKTITLDSLDLTRQYSDNYGVKIKGYLRAPVTGQYRFHVSGDDAVQFWLSSDQSEINEKMIAYTNDWTFPQEWNKYGSQNSSLISLVAGKQYYFEMYLVESKFDDHASVWWTLPNKSAPERITSQYLSNQLITTSTSTDLIVRALGTKANNIFAGFVVQNRSRQVTDIQLTNSIFTDYRFSVDGSPKIEDLTVNFINDGTFTNSNGVNEDRNLSVEYVILNGVTYTTKDTKTFSSGMWFSGKGCTSGNFGLQELHCNGYFKFSP